MISSIRYINSSSLIIKNKFINLIFNMDKTKEEQSVADQNEAGDKKLALSKAQKKKAKAKAKEETKEPQPEATAEDIDVEPTSAGGAGAKGKKGKKGPAAAAGGRSAIAKQIADRNRIKQEEEERIRKEEEEIKRREEEEERLRKLALEE